MSNTGLALSAAGRQGAAEDSRNVRASQPGAAEAQSSDLPLAVPGSLLPAPPPCIAAAAPAPATCKACSRSKPGYFMTRMKPRPIVGADVRRRSGAHPGPQRPLTSAPTTGMKNPSKVSAMVPVRARPSPLPPGAGREDGRAVVVHPTVCPVSHRAAAGGASVAGVVSCRPHGPFTRRQSPAAGDGGCPISSCGCKAWTD
jgi:hypothetical protein